MSETGKTARIASRLPIQVFQHKVWHRANQGVQAHTSAALFCGILSRHQRRVRHFRGRTRLGNRRSVQAQRLEAREEDRHDEKLPLRPDSTDCILRRPNCTDDFVQDVVSERLIGDEEPDQLV